MHEIHNLDAGFAQPEQLSQIDLNLLVAFDALAREQSVTRAARRTGVTQSAMSHTLRRLRDLLGDPLLVRGRGGMVLTPRAAALVAPLRSGLVTLGRALAQPSQFEPGSARRAFSIASPDLYDVLAIPPLLERIRSEAPGVDIAVVAVGESGLSDRLETGELDVAVVPALEGGDKGSEVTHTGASGLMQRTLFRDTFTCLIRADHPAITEVPCPGDEWPAPNRLPLDTYIALSHALVSPSGEGLGLVDRLLEQQGLKRRIALRLPHFYTAPAIIAQSDLVLTAPTALAYLVADDKRLVALSPPLALPDHALNLVWHERFSSDPGHRWLRELIGDVSAGLLPPDQI